jgi:hypothetical protein
MSHEAMGKLGKAPNEAMGKLGKAPNEAMGPCAAPNEAVGKLGKAPNEATGLCAAPNEASSRGELGAGDARTFGQTLTFTRPHIAFLSYDR